MKNAIQVGDVLEMAAPYDVLAGEGAMVGDLFCVAMVDMLTGVRGSWSVSGVYAVKKEATTAAFAEGDKVYWNDSTKQLDEQGTGLFFAGTCTKAAIASDATVEMKVLGHGVGAEA